MTGRECRVDRGRIAAHCCVDGGPVGLVDDETDPIVAAHTSAALSRW
jgi:hypothetical protein